MEVIKILYGEVQKEYLEYIMHVHAKESSLGNVEHWPIQFVLEVDPDFARRLGLGLPDGQDDRLFLFFR